MKALALALAAAAIVSAQTGGGATGFTVHEIGTGLRGGYQVVVTDLNKDGKPDIIALASGCPNCSGTRIPVGRSTCSPAACRN
jgi:hypothetical protein